MGLPLVPALLQSAVTSGLAGGRRVCECGSCTFTSGHRWKRGPQEPGRQWGTAAGQISRVFTMQRVTVRVPGSTSNLGPGFDCLGIALRIHNSVTVIRATSRHSHPRIVLETADRFFKQAGCRAFPFSYSIMEQVPRCRGLGGSATVRLGILLALNRLSGDPLHRSAAFGVCAELEGHPDNAAPAMFGGFTVVGPQRFADRTPQPGVPTVHRFKVSSRVYFVLLIPDLEIQTKRARTILPSKISWIAAVENCANACMTTAAFASRHYERLRGTFTDHLHQPFRSKLIPFFPRVIAAAENAGALGAFLSGSGSTIAAVTLHAPEKIAGAMLGAARASARTIITHADNRGAQVSGN